MDLLFPLAEYWWFYLGFTLFVFAVLLLDLGLFHRNAHEVSFKEAAGWSVVWVGLALLFNVLFYVYAQWKFAADPRLLAIPGFDPELAARQSALEFLSGYVVEKALAVDNIFVFIIVFSFFGIPNKYQHRILFFGILGALVFRGVFIALGSVLMQYEAVVIIFGAFLVLTGLKMLFVPEKPLDPESNWLVQKIRKILPVTPRLHEGKFFVRENGVLFATPLFLTLIFIELSDIVFAVDSVPAIFALTKEPLIVFTSNIFAILGLRSMYFLLAGVMDKFHYLKTGLAFVLMFVGLKMAWLNELMGGKFPVSYSLSIIAAILAVAIAASLMFPKPQAGSEVGTGGESK